MTLVLPPLSQDPFKSAVAFPPISAPVESSNLRSIIQNQRELLAHLQPPYTRFDTNTHIYITIPKPMLPVKDLHLQFHDQFLTLSGHTKNLQQKRDKDALLQQISQVSQSSYFQQIPLGQIKINQKKATMTLDEKQENLLISLPKSYPSKPVA